MSADANVEQAVDALPDGETRTPVAGDTLTVEGGTTTIEDEADLMRAARAPSVNSMNLIEFLEHKACKIRESAEHQAQQVEAQAAALRARAEGGEEHVVALLKHTFGELAALLHTYREHL